MTPLNVAELVAGYVVLAGIFCLAILVVVVNKYGGILDGTHFGSALDDRDRARHLLDAALAEDAQVAELDALYELPARAHP